MPTAYIGAGMERAGITAREERLRGKLDCSADDLRIGLKKACSDEGRNTTLDDAKERETDAGATFAA